MTDHQKVNVTEEQRKKLDDAKKQLAANREAQAKTGEQQEAVAAGKPTPTQEENDLAKLGGYLPEHEADGSPEQVPPGTPQTKQSEAKKPASAGNYETRTVKPATT